METHETFDRAHETFRDELASVQKDGRRRWVYARKPSGPIVRVRTLVSWVLLAFLVLAPFIRLHGQPLILLNVLERRFIVFGIVFWPQDFYLLVLCVLAGFLTIALATASIGRVWCGWACPQTIFMEMVFRKIEFAIDGSAQQQVRRDKGPLTFDTIWRRVLKHAIFFAVSFGIANVFLAYIISAETLYTIVTDPPREHLTGLAAITVFSLVFYAVFARFREQVCTLACPYGRVMGALLDESSLTTTYDRRRGEPRGKLVRGATTGDTAAPRGDCVDCGQCVTVCPTGIDIRNGIQLECINCTACIDACNDVMVRVGRPTGLIRYTSETAVRTGQATWFTTRVKAYATVWLVLVTAATTLIATRPDLGVLILRQPGTVQTVFDNGDLGNFYALEVINRASRSYPLTYAVTQPAGGSITTLGDIDSIEPYGQVQGRFMVRLPSSAVSQTSTPVRIEVRSGETIIDTITTSFLGITRPAP